MNKFNAKTQTHKQTRCAIRADLLHINWSKQIIMIENHNIENVTNMVQLKPKQKNFNRENEHVNENGKLT